MTLRAVHVVGARPNFMKAAPVIRALAQGLDHVEQLLIHTGQHYDRNMSEAFFADLGLPPPYLDLGIGSGTRSHQVAQTVARFEDVARELQPDLIVVVGDVNSTLGAAIVAAKLGVPLAHVEAGLRSFDDSMPEELNRVHVDRLSDFLFAPSPDAVANLRREQVPGAVHFVGNVMIDSLTRLLPDAYAIWPALRRSLGVGDRFVAVTLHRPANVDDPDVFAAIVEGLQRVAADFDVVFPMHPRTRQRAGASLRAAGRLHVVEPLGYREFLALEAHASLVITDSGGIQEETTYLGIPCLTVRASTERPITISAGTNSLVDADSDAIVSAAVAALSSSPRVHEAPELWDGHAGERIAAVLADQPFLRAT